MQLARIMFIVLINCISIGTRAWHILRARRWNVLDSYSGRTIFVLKLVQGNKDASTKIDLDILIVSPYLLTYGD